MGFSAAGLVYGITAAVTAGYGIYSGERQNKVQETGLKRQQRAQQTAEDAALRQRKDAAQAAAAAARQQPDLADIMAGEQELSRLGSSSTMLTGPGGARRRQGGPAQLLGD